MFSPVKDITFLEGELMCKNNEINNKRAYAITRKIVLANIIHVHSHEHS